VAYIPIGCYNTIDMADWRQIQARIRKAKNSADASTKLSELYQRTSDAMVAWELALIEEKAERTAEAGKWYQIAAQRFRRADWKKKAEEALTRLGIELPTAPVEVPAKPAAGPAAARSERAKAPESGESQMPLALGEIPEGVEGPEDEEISASSDSEASDDSADATAAALSAATPTGEAGKKKRRRGRRGGRGRRRGPAASVPGLPAKTFASPVEPIISRLGPPPELARASFDTPIPVRRPAPVEIHAPASSAGHAPQLPSERTAHGRAGDPALASRMAHLESMLRRLVAGPLHRLDEADTAPAGPGVFLLSDSDQISVYYIEACQTLRVGIGNLARGGRSGKPAAGRGYSADSGLKSKLAEHLGINESKVSQYMKDHCVVRWIQLDDDAPLLAHFSIAVLRTPLNLD
jgi:hypothetical protein